MTNCFSSTLNFGQIFSVYSGVTPRKKNESEIPENMHKTTKFHKIL